MVRGGCPALNGDVPDNLPVISRPRDGAMIGGVCAGLARRWQIDPMVLRITVVVLAFFGGLGLVAYAAGVLLMPREGLTEPPVHRLLPFTRTWSRSAVVAMVVAAAVVVAGIIGSQGIGIGPLAVIFGIWFFGVRGRGHSANRMPAPPPEPTPFERAADHWRQRLVEQQTPGYVGIAAAPAAAPAPAEQRWTQPYTDPATDLAVRDDDLPVAVPARPVRRWRMWWLALGLAGLGTALVAVLGVVLGIPMGPLVYAAAVLAAFGLTLVVSSWRGRPPLLLPATLATAAVTGWLMLLPYSGAVVVGDVAAAYSGNTFPPHVVTRAVGDVSLDLRKLAPETDENLTINVGTGDVSLQLPEAVNTEIRYKVGLGDFTFNGTPDDTGYLWQRGKTAGEDAATVRITVNVGIGDLDVVQR